MQIYTPLRMVKAIKTTEDSSYQICTKIRYFDCEISIVMDQSCDVGNDLNRTEIRVYWDEQDITEEFMKDGTDQDMLTDAEDLHRVMNEIAKRSRWISRVRKNG